MDFAKFVSFLDTGQLFFARADKLGDPFEGAFPKPDAIKMKWRENPENMPFYSSPKQPDETYSGRQIAEFISHTTKNYRKDIYKLPQYFAINCWHMNNQESSAMWKLYLQSNEGIAIQSTYSRLRDSFTDGETIFIGVVNYIDYETESIPIPSEIVNFVCKRKNFEHEREIRAIINKLPYVTPLSFDLNRETEITNGLKINVDITKLVERIFIAPSAPVWFNDLVHTILIKFGYNFEVVQSKLSESPVYAEEELEVIANQMSTIVENSAKQTMDCVKAASEPKRKSEENTTIVLFQKLWNVSQEVGVRIVDCEFSDKRLMVKYRGVAPDHLKEKMMLLAKEADYALIIKNIGDGSI